MPDTRTFANEISQATLEMMKADPDLLCFGLGVNDPGRVFGTTEGLVEEFGPERVFETPTSENAMTGFAVGAALGGNPVIMSHQRVDFALLALDQIVNSAAKWHFMFGGQFSVPITIRMIVGRGWGQGPTHAQTLHSYLRQVPGLRICYPSAPSNVGELLKASVRDRNPTIFFEDRWLHGIANSSYEQESEEFRPGLGTIVREGQSVTVVAWGYGVREALIAAEASRSKSFHPEVFDPRWLSPFDWPLLFSSVRKTRKLLVVDLGPYSGSFGHEIVSVVKAELGERFFARVLAGPDWPSPSSPTLSRDFWVTARDIQLAMLDFGAEVPAGGLLEPADIQDVPPSNRTDPF